MKVSTETYGFISWLVSFVAYGLYMIWVFVPDDVLESFGVHYHPSKFWALSLTMYFPISVLFVPFISIAGNWIQTPHFDSPNNLCLESTVLEYNDETLDSSVPAVGEMSISEVNHFIYGTGLREYSCS
eukprot:GDKJ01022353.1.p1 GENE.GDKJ01022353.1~~GDKJ01022353.1.p1  ORF type:complete len:128 (-),score=4.39 GDKJ01022353.1:27-410(-)